MAIRKRKRSTLFPIVLLVGICLLPSITSCVGKAIPPASRVEAIIVDMPHGWWRVQIYPDGSGAYGFGALPEMGAIQGSTFNFKEVYSELAKKVTRDRNNIEQVGTVQFCVEEKGCGQLFYFEDRQYAESLFDKAFENRTGTSAIGGFGVPFNLDRMWRERESS